MPFELLGKDKARFEGVAHNHVNEHDRHDKGGGPGHHAAHPGVQGIDPTAKLGDNSHAIFFHGEKKIPSAD